MADRRAAHSHAPSSQALAFQKFKSAMTNITFSLWYRACEGLQGEVLGLQEEDKFKWKMYLRDLQEEDFEIAIKVEVLSHN